MHACTVPFVFGAWLLLSPTQQQERRDLYDEKADAASGIETARVRTATENRRVLIVWGADEFEPCQKLEVLFQKDLREKLLYEYDVVRVASLNVELARRYGADIEKIGVPYLTVLDAKGAVLANQAASALVGDSKPLLDFLTHHQAPYEKADDVRARALKEAAVAGKKLLLTFGAPW